MKADKREMKRSRQQKLLAVETVNLQNIDRLVAILNQVMAELAVTQREFIILKTSLIEKRIVSDFELEQTRLQIKQFEEMKAKGLILGEK